MIGVQQANDFGIRLLRTMIPERLGVDAVRIHRAELRSQLDFAVDHIVAVDVAAYEADHDDGRGGGFGGGIRGGGCARQKYDQNRNRQKSEFAHCKWVGTRNPTKKYFRSQTQHTSNRKARGIARSAGARTTESGQVHEVDCRARSQRVRRLCARPRGHRR